MNTNPFPYLQVQRSSTASRASPKGATKTQHLSLLVLFICSADNHNAEHLLTLDGAEERLHLFKANLLEDGSFDSAVDGCEGVFHTASPVVVSANDPQVLLICFIFTSMSFY